MKLNLLLDVKQDEVKKACKGVFWRGHVSSYEYDGVIGVKKTLRLLKKKSCPGCPHCGWLQDYLAEDVCNEPNIDYLGDIEDGALYTYNVESSQGYYDLYPEIDEIKFIKVEEK